MLALQTNAIPKHLSTHLVVWLLLSGLTSVNFLIGMLFKKVTSTATTGMDAW
jgi:hypothetical protein